MMMRIIILFFTLVLLNACAPSPAPEVAPCSELPSQTTIPAEEPMISPSTEKDSTEDFDFHALHRTVDSLLFAGDTLQAIFQLQRQVQTANNLNELGKRSFLLAKLLHSVGKDVEALEVIGAFVSYKPSLLEWIDKAENLEREIRGEQKEQVQDLQPIVKQISNFIATSGDYGLVRELTDSLRNQRIPDSLRQWCRIQDSIALRRTVSKLSPRMESVRKIALENGNYEKARANLNILRQLHPEIVSALKVDSVGTWLEKKEKQEKESQSPGFWKGKEPQKVWEEAKRYIREKNWEKGLFLYHQLQTSPLRKQVMQEMQSVGEAYCQNQRQAAADEYSRSRNDNPDKAKMRIQNALKSLNSCLSEFPDYSSALKVRQNVEMLEKEMERRTP